MSQGQAVVLDNPRDPMAILMAGQQQRAAYGLRQQQLGQQRQKDAQDDMNKVLAHKYEDPGDRFRSWGQEIVNKANQDVMGVYQSNPNADPLQLRSQILDVQGKADKTLKYATEINNIYKEKVASLGEMKGIVDQEEAKRIMNQAIAKDDPFKVDRSLLENIEQVPAVYDKGAILAESVTHIKDQFRKVAAGDIKSSGLGLFMEIHENKMRFKDMEKTMDFLLRGDDVTEEGIQQKINGGLLSDRLRYEIAQEEVGRKGGDPQDVSQVMTRFKEIQYDKKYAPEVRKRLRPMLEQLQQEERDVDIQTLGKFPTKTKSVTDKLKENRLMMRSEHLKNLQNPFDDKGNVRPEAQAALPRILQGDFGGGKITDAKFKKGQYTTSPEWTARIRDDLNAVLSDPQSKEAKKRLQQTIRESQKHLIQKSAHNINLSIKTGTIFGEATGFTSETGGTDITPISLDLSDRGTRSVLNALMNKNAGEERIALDDVDFFEKGGTQDAGGYIDEDDDEGYID